MAASDAPRVTDPSTVISGNAKIRKLMNTPKASNDRMKPMVNVPTRRFMRVPRSFLLRHRTDPACAADKHALLCPGGVTIIGQKVEHTLQGFRLEQSCLRSFQIDISLLERPIRKRRCVKVSHWRCFAAGPPQHGSQRLAGGTGCKS